MTIFWHSGQVSAEAREAAGREKLGPAKSWTPRSRAGASPPQESAGLFGLPKRHPIFGRSVMCRNARERPWVPPEYGAVRAVIPYRPCIRNGVLDVPVVLPFPSISFKKGRAAGRPTYRRSRILLHQNGPETESARRVQSELGYSFWEALLDLDKIDP
jgi:hypothetical protein